MLKKYRITIESLDDTTMDTSVFDVVGCQINYSRQIFPSWPKDAGRLVLTGSQEATISITGVVRLDDLGLPDGVSA